MPPTTTILLKNASIPRNFRKRFGLPWQEEERAFSYADIVIKDNKVHKIYEKIGRYLQEPGSAHEVIHENGRAAPTIYELGGRTLCPGFVDGHTHLFHYSRIFLSADLTGCSSKQEAIAKARAFLQEQEEPLTALVALNLDESQWDEKRYPERGDLDQIAADIPVVCVRVCGHMVFLNSLALDTLLGQLEQKKDTGELSPEELEELRTFIDVDRGHVTEKVMWHLSELFSLPEERRLQGLESAIDHFTSLGITEIHDIFPPETLELYHRFFEREDLAQAVFPMNVKGYLIIPGSQEGFDTEVAEEQWDLAQAHMRNIKTVLARKGMDGQFHLVGIKLFLDGSLGARTAALLEDYADAPGEKGTVLLTHEDLTRAFLFCCQNDIELMVHVIGDRSLHEIIISLERFTRNPSPDRTPGGRLRIRLEHVEVLPDSLLERMKELDENRVNLTLSMMPNFAGVWSTLPDGMNIQRLGKERYILSDRFKSAYYSGLPLIFGSDGMPPGPLYGIRSAVHNPNTGELLGLPESMDCYTGGVPLTSGSSAANLVLLSHDLTTGKTEEELENVKVVAVFFKGKPVLVDEKEGLLLK